jgi:hypothetical protein
MSLPKIDSLIQMMNGKGSRSTILIELRWLVAFLTIAVVVVASARAPAWVCVCLFGFDVLAGAALVKGWWYWSKKDPNMLRTESFLLHQQQMQLMAEKNKPAFIDVAAKRVDSPTDPAIPPAALLAPPQNDAVE